MTLPYERSKAVLNTQQFLLELAYKEPRIPSKIRCAAKALLRHYPTKYELELVYSEWNSVFQCPFGDYPT